MSIFIAETVQKARYKISDAPIFDDASLHLDMADDRGYYICRDYDLMDLLGILPEPLLIEALKYAGKL